jgi:hypothetical protein
MEGMAGSLDGLLRLRVLSVGCIGLGSHVAFTITLKWFVVYCIANAYRVTVECVFFIFIFVHLMLTGSFGEEGTDRACIGVKATERVIELAVSRTARSGLSACGRGHFEPLSAPAAPQAEIDHVFM